MVLDRALSPGSSLTDAENGDVSDIFDDQPAWIPIIVGSHGVLGDVLSVLLVPPHGRPVSAFLDPIFRPSVLGAIPHEERAGVSVSGKEDEVDSTEGSSFGVSSCSLGSFGGTGAVFLGTFARRNDSAFEGNASGDGAFLLGTLSRRDGSEFEGDASGDDAVFLGTFPRRDGSDFEGDASGDGAFLLGTFPRRDDSDFEGDASGDDAVFLGTTTRRDDSVLPTVVFFRSNSKRDLARSYAKERL
jgi:hypothetical protein